MGNPSQAAQNEKKNKQKIQTPVAASPGSVANLMPEIGPAFNGPSVEAQADMLNRLPAAQGQMVAKKIGETQGNRHLQRVMTSLKNTPVQAKLSVSEPGDEYELEADQVAEQVMKMPAPATPPPPPADGDDSAGEDPRNRNRPASLNRYVQRATAMRSSDGIGGNEVDPGVESRIQNMQRGGAPMPQTERAFFESRMGVDLGNVKIHNDSEAAATSEKLNAQAYTVGSNIAFGAGKYAPGTTAGRRLMAHELTHVVQQGGAGELRRDTNDEPPTPTTAPTPGNPPPVTTPTPPSSTTAPANTPTPVTTPITTPTPITTLPTNTPSPTTPQPTDPPTTPATPQPTDPPATPQPIETPSPATPQPIETPSPATPQPTDTPSPATPQPIETPSPATPQPPKNQTNTPPSQPEGLETLSSLSTSNLALIDEELAEHQRWGGALGKVGEAGSAGRAKFIAETAGAGFLYGAGTGFGLGLLTGTVGRLAAKFIPIPGVGPILGGAMSAYGLATKDWSATGQTISEFGQGSSEYEKLANSLEAVGEVVDILGNVASVVGGIAGIVAAVAGALSLTVVLAPVTAPVATVALQIATGAGIVSGVLDAINSFVLQPTAMLFRALHMFKSDADPRAIEVQGADLTASAGKLGTGLGSWAGSKTADAVANKTYDKPKVDITPPSNKDAKSPQKTESQNTKKSDDSTTGKDAGKEIVVGKKKSGAELAKEQKLPKLEDGYYYARKPGTDNEVIIKRKPGNPDLKKLELDPVTKTVVPAQSKTNKGRGGRQKKLRELMTDKKLGKADKGWLKQEYNRVKKGKASGMRVPPGKELAHKPGYEAAKGYDYSYSNLQDKSLHDLQHGTERKYNNKKKAEQTKIIEDAVDEELAIQQTTNQNNSEESSQQTTNPNNDEKRNTTYKTLTDPKNKDNYEVNGPDDLLLKNDKAETKIEHVNPNYTDPPGTPEQIEAIKDEILQLLKTRAEAEKAETEMTDAEKQHQDNQDPLQEAVDETAGAITANEAHQQAVARRQEANQEQQKRQQEAQGDLMSYANRKTGLAVLTVPLFGFERFTHYASKALGKVKSISWLLPDGIENQIMAWKDKMDAMNKDARGFQSALGQMDSAMSEQSAAQPAKQQELTQDQTRIETVEEKATTTQQEFEQSSEGAQNLQQLNEEKITEATEAKEEAAEQRETADEMIVNKETQAQTLAEQLQAWANEHKAAREAAIQEAKARLQKQGYEITDGSEGS